MTVEPPPPPWQQARRFYDRISRAYDLLADASEHDARERGLALLDARPGDRVLEIGFGTGQAIAALAQAVGARGRVTGLDVSEGMIAQTRQRLASAPPPAAVHLLLGDVRAIPLADAVVDAVFASFTLELIDPPGIPGVLAEIARVLRPGGRVGLVALSLHDRPNTITRLYQWLHQHFPHFVDCQPIRVGELLRQGRFALEDQQELSLWGLPVAIATARRSP